MARFVQVKQANTQEVFLLNIDQITDILIVRASEDLYKVFYGLPVHDAVEQLLNVTTHTTLKDAKAEVNRVLAVAAGAVEPDTYVS